MCATIIPDFASLSPDSSVCDRRHTYFTVTVTAVELEAKSPPSPLYFATIPKFPAGIPLLEAVIEPTPPLNLAVPSAIVA
jgi:hypothetical protein